MPESGKTRSHLDFKRLFYGENHLFFRFWQHFCNIFRSFLSLRLFVCSLGVFWIVCIRLLQRLPVTFLCHFPASRALLLGCICIKRIFWNSRFCSCLASACSTNLSVNSSRPSLTFSSFSLQLLQGSSFPDLS